MIKPTDLAGAESKLIKPAVDLEFWHLGWMEADESWAGQRQH